MRTDDSETGHPPQAPLDGAAVVAALRTCLRGLESLPDTMDRLDVAELADAMSALMYLHGRSEQLATLVARRASERGDVQASDAANTTQWVGNCAKEASTPLDVRDAHTIGAVADACRGDAHQPVTDALRAGTCTPAVARAALTEVAKIEPIIPETSHDDALGHYLALDPATGVRGREMLTRQILADHDEDELDTRDATLERTESLSWRITATGMTRLSVELSPVNAAIVTEALQALSAPRRRVRTQRGDNSADTSEGGEYDERTPGKRRVDALVALVSRGARLHDGETTGAGSAARVTITIPVHTLMGGGTAAKTSAGDILDAGAARRLACDADIIPAVLGTDSEPLDVGRSKRLVTKAIRAAVTLRDHGCTFPGCDRPPPFCEVHHIVPWAAGGVTSLLNSAMLCTTHHQTVHRHGYRALATALRVTWDLTRGPTTSRGRDAA